MRFIEKLRFPQVKNIDSTALVSAARYCTCLLQGARVPEGVRELYQES